MNKYILYYITSKRYTRRTTERDKVYNNSMASLTTTNTQPPAKRLKQSTIDALQEKPTRTIVIGT